MPAQRHASLVDWATAKELVSTADAAFLLGLDVATVQRLIEEGGVDVVEHAGQAQIVTASLREWQDVYYELFGGAELTEYISTAEAAEISGYTENYIRRLVRQHKVKAERKSGVYWIDKVSFDAYLESVKELGTQRFNWRRLEGQ